jgi:hypothetical protein
MRCNNSSENEIKTVPFKVRITFFLPAKSCHSLPAMNILQLQTLAGPIFISHIACIIH